MKKINQEAVAAIDFEMKWKSADATHTEGYDARNVNFWKDCLPEPLWVELENKTEGDRVIVDFDPGSIVPEYDERKIFEIKDAQFDRRFSPHENIEPRIGRFYPKGILKGIAGIFPQNLKPFRCVGIHNGRLRVDFNHPLSKQSVQVEAVVKKIRRQSAQMGGRCQEWVERMATGPGMQSRWENQVTDFFSDNSFRRENERPDRIFYRNPRLVPHLDETALQVVENLYGRLLKDGMRVLDLMSSWKSHIPEDLSLGYLSGLGLNDEELKKNSRLNDRVIHDLNDDPTLPFETESYDSVICTVSVEYLIHPETVFKEIARILRPEGLFIVTFSNRWFPPKVVDIWKKLHEFERLGLILEYFRRTERFIDIKTYTMRGLPRPTDDQYFPEMTTSAPIFAIYGRKA